MKAIRLKTQYMKNPMGIECRNPRFTWNAEDGVTQTGYEIRTWKNGEKDWESGIVKSGSMYAYYSGELGSRDIVEWQIRLYDEDGREGEWSSRQSFEMGLLRKEDWKAKWICGIDTDKEERLPADYYRKSFSVKGDIERARLYMTTCGVYEAKINGIKVGNQILSPGCTEYGKRLYYQTYDVGGLLDRENILDIVVGDGWFKGKLGCDGEEFLFGTQTKLLAQLEIVYTDGTAQIVGTDDSFFWSNCGPVLYSDLKDGIIMDMTKELRFTKKAVLTDYPVLPSAPECPPIKEHEVFVPKVLKSPSGKTILDFQQNIAGYVSFHFKGNAGQKVTVWMGETLDHGEFTQENFVTLPERGKSIDQKIEVVCDGKNVPDYPKFFYSGFRYALVEGLGAVFETDFSAVAVYTDLEYESSFTCSNEDINQFVKNTIWSEKDNFVDIPTDCPQREKAGWTGDAQVFAPTAMFFADTAAFFRKWLRDVRDCQNEAGRVDNICPKVDRPGMMDSINGSVGWADAAVMIPYLLWKSYGDESFITENYELMHGWKEYVIAAMKDKSIYQLVESVEMLRMVKPYLMGDVPYSEYLMESGTHWGEWAEPEGVLETDGMVEIMRPKQEEAAAYTHYSMRLLAEMLETVGRTEEAIQCRAISDGTKKAYLYHFVKDGKIDGIRQCKFVRPIAFGLLEGKVKEHAAERLNQIVLEKEYKIGTGFLSTPFILQALADNGYVETAYRMLENKEEPGWLAMVKQGATTVWEHYNGYDAQGHPLKTSYNHYSPGAVCRFLLEYTAGIRQTGEREFLIKPVVDASLEYAQAAWLSPYGKLETDWKCVGNTYRYNVVIPANCIAVVELPDGRKESIHSGKYCYEFVMNN